MPSHLEPVRKRFGTRDSVSSSHLPDMVSSPIDGVNWSVLAPLHIAASVDLTDESKKRRKDLMNKWKDAAYKAARRMYADPWRKYNIHALPTIRARRHRYSSIRKTWTEDIVEVKMLAEPFARGAMRECFRLKKLSTIDHNSDWTKAQNYVAKRYIQEVDRSVLFEDVKLQMDCKLWAEEFNRYDPPKKIDIVQMCVLEMFDLPGEPLYHLEHFIEGNYVKYNSNSGFVSEVARKTPQSFSHFTFERSGHQMIVVDIQGVGDLYTDPQIHTVNGMDYGDGNLGTRGMALFFHSHQCNDICHLLCLTEFDLSDSERQLIAEGIALSVPPTTRFVRQRSSNSVCEAIVHELVPADAMECLRVHTASIRSRTSSTTTSSHANLEHNEDCVCEACLDQIANNTVLFDEEDEYDNRSEVSSMKDSYDGSDKPRPIRKMARPNLSVERSDRVRFDSMCSSHSQGSSSRLTGKTERDEYWVNSRKKSMPAGLLNAMQHQCFEEEAAKVTRHISVLGQIHLDMARYHEIGRFRPENDNGEKKRVLEEFAFTDSLENPGSADGNYDRQSALYHLDVARRCGVLEAVLTVAQMVYGLPHELLKDVGNDENWFHDENYLENQDREKFGFELMTTAAEMGDRGAMLFLAESYETGRNMGKGAAPCYPDSILWYQKCMGFADDENSAGTGKPRYEILSKMAHMYQEGGFGLDMDLDRAYELYNEAADAAMEAMKGKLANQYYEKAEMCVC